MKTEAAERCIAALDTERVAAYEKYFATLFPADDVEIFRRWLFAYASVHTTWKYNCRLYEALKGLEWLGDFHRLLGLIRGSRAGLHNNRAHFIMQFSQFFWKHPTWFRKMPGENWFEHRDRVMSKALGIGPAKASFALELIHFHTADIACIDTHMIQLYGLTASAAGQGRVSESTINAMEAHWVDRCRSSGVSPVTARWVFWDQKQQQPDSRYWSYVLESKGVTECQN